MPLTPGGNAWRLDPATIRNVAFAGTQAAAKPLVEASSSRGDSRRAGGDGTTASDFDAQEKAHKHSIDLSWVHADVKGTTINILDMPGYRDFIGQAYCAAAVVESVVLVVDADEGVRPNTRKVWQIAEAAGLPCLVVVNRCDRDQAKIGETVAQIQEQLSTKSIPLFVPSGGGASFGSVEPILGNKAPSAAAKEAAGKFLDVVVESNDALMERYLGGEAIPDEEVKEQLKQAFAARIFPCSSRAGRRTSGQKLTVPSGLAPASNPLGRVADHPDEDPGKDGVDDHLRSRVPRRGDPTSVLTSAYSPAPLPTTATS